MGGSRSPQPSRRHGSDRRALDGGCDTAPRHYLLFPWFAEVQNDGSIIGCSGPEPPVLGALTKRDEEDPCRDKRSCVAFRRPPAICPSRGAVAGFASITPGRSDPFLGKRALVAHRDLGYPPRRQCRERLGHPLARGSRGLVQAALPRHDRGAGRQGSVAVRSDLRAGRGLQRPLRLQRLAWPGAGLDQQRPHHSRHGQGKRHLFRAAGIQHGGDAALGDLPGDRPHPGARPPGREHAQLKSWLVHGLHQRSDQDEGHQRDAQQHPAQLARFRSARLDLQAPRLRAAGLDQAVGERQRGAGADEGAARAPRRRRRHVSSGVGQEPYVPMLTGAPGCSSGAWMATSR